MKKIVIIGTGISALSAGWFLKKKYGESIAITFVEKNSCSGGLIRTIQQKEFLFEQGPRGFRPSGAGQTTLDLAKELGLDNELLYASDLAKSRYLYRKGKLVKITPLFLLSNGLLAGAVKDLFTKPSRLEDESVGDFIRRRFNRRFLENIVDPLIKGIYGGDPDTLSMKSCFPFFWHLEKKEGSLVKGMIKLPKNPSRLASFKHGMQTLPKALEKKIKAQFFFEEKVEKIEKKDGIYELFLKNKTIEAHSIIFAISDQEISLFFPLPRVILKRISLVTVNMGWRGRKLPFRGYGFLVPSHEHKKLMGMTFDSDIFPEQTEIETTRITAMVQGEEENMAIDCALQEAQKLLKITEPPDMLIAKPHREAIPQYTLGYEKRLMSFRNELPSHIYAIGSSFEGVAVNECIQNAKKFALELFNL